MGVRPLFAMMVRHPAAVIDSRRRWYGGRQEDVSRAAGWVNLELFTERATRDVPRSFVLYQDLLDDWARTIERVGKDLDLSVVASASVREMQQVERFLDPSLSRSPTRWEGVDIPPSLRERADEIWTLLCRLADPSEEAPAEVTQRLDALRADYVALYEEAEGIARSSIWAARRGRRAAMGAPTRPSAGPARRLVRRFVPTPLRRAAFRLLRRRR
jgi:hypothetical protein